MCDSICDIMMNEHEKFLKTHTVIHVCSHKPKTPYQLDLEVKGRKPDIVPKVGDKVKIKSREWYEKWKDSEGDVSFSGSGCCFVPNMANLCGRIFSVDSVINFIGENRYCLGFRNYYFVPEMFEEVYPQEPSKEEKCTKGLYSSSNSASALAKQLTGTSAIPAINPVQGIGIATDWSKLVSDTAARITLPQQNLFCSPGFYCQSLLEKEEPELQTIKKHRFIKLEKL